MIIYVIPPPPPPWQIKTARRRDHERITLFTKIKMKNSANLRDYTKMDYDPHHPSFPGAGRERVIIKEYLYIKIENTKS